MDRVDNEGLRLDVCELDAEGVLDVVDELSGVVVEPFGCEKIRVNFVEDLHVDDLDDSVDEARDGGVELYNYDNKYISGLRS